ncbi:MAG: hypothetical protein AAF696_26890 [Bacteroidota bacterium]
MNKIILQDKEGHEVAEIEIQSIKNGLVLGSLLKQSFSMEQESQFKEFAGLVNEQVFSLLDGIIRKIDAKGYRIKNKDWEIYDIQIFDNQISLRIN